jgi:hypothetical protein
MTQKQETRILANKILDRINADPDDDLAMLSRELLRADEVIQRMRSAACNACQILDVVKQEWDVSWSAWDQSVRDELSLIAAQE